MLPFMRNIFSSSFLLIPFFVENYNVNLFLLNFDKEPSFLVFPKILLLFILFLIIPNVLQWLPVTPETFHIRGKMNKNKNMAREQHEEENALVIWNISNCPIPDGHDPLQVVPRIQTALEKLRRDRPYGPLSITAISDNLTEIPGEDVMRKLSSTGISLKHAHGVQTDLYQWASRNPPPATIMVITGHEELEHLASTFSGLEEEGYIILPTYPQPNPAPPSLPKLCFWETLLSDADNKLVTTSRLIFHGTGGYPWSCSVCYFDAPILEDFTNHLKSETHAYFEWDRFASKNKIDRTNPANMQLGRSQEWDLLAKPDMIRGQLMPTLLRNRSNLENRRRVVDFAMKFLVFLQ